MNKEVLRIFFLFVALFGAALLFSTGIQRPILSLTNSIKSSYHNTTAAIGKHYDEHFAQRDSIIELREKLALYEESHLLLHQVATELNALFVENNSSFKVNPDVTLVRTISYVKFGDINKVWIDTPAFNASKVYGLVHKENVAGIVIMKEGRAMALLNGASNSSYAVYVGEDNAPGIVHGLNTKELLVEFIPTWINIKVGDEVFTSGLDNLFFPGLKVGKVISIEQSQGYQNAVIKPYYNASNPDYFHLIKKIR
ncbi:MAG: rod shape-determining protein MreC [Helicobacteraceae bacterium]|jgi:rod shape-determining protein MreC|nr:rod shape-determining protein MreC [Helicobacteraceae bacterium]